MYNNSFKVKSSCFSTENLTRKTLLDWFQMSEIWKFLQFTGGWRSLIRRDLSNSNCYWMWNFITFRNVACASYNLFYTNYMRNNVKFPSIYFHVSVFGCRFWQLINKKFILSVGRVFLIVGNFSSWTFQSFFNSQQNSFMLVILFITKCFCVF